MTGSRSPPNPTTGLAGPRLLTELRVVPKVLTLTAKGARRLK